MKQQFLFKLKITLITLLRATGTGIGDALRRNKTVSDFSPDERNRRISEMLWAYKFEKDGQISRGK
jgi:hypothetical protein